MSLPAVQARREKREAISFRRPTQNPISRNQKRPGNEEGTSDKRQEQRLKYESK